MPGCARALIGKAGEKLEGWLPRSYKSHHLLILFLATVSIESILHAARISDVRIPNNPESFVHFAVAAYLYQNPPVAPSGSPPKPAVVFPGGVPRTIIGIMEPGSNIMLKGQIGTKEVRFKHTIIGYQTVTASAEFVA